MKKLIATLLLVCFLLPLAVSCGGNTTPAVTTDAPDAVTTAPNDTAPAVTTEYPDIPQALDYDAYEFVILTCLADSIVFNDFSDQNTDYDVVNEAIFKRNSDVESTLNIVIENAVVTGNVFSGGIGTETVRKDYTAGESQYDLCGISTWHATACATSGYLLDLNEIPYIDLSRSWWDQRANIDLGIQGKMFFSNGDIGITDNLATHCIVFSKAIAEEKSITDIYDLVLNYKWTWDKFEEYVHMVSDDLNGDDMMTENDRFGLLCWNDAFQASFGGARSKLAGVDETTGDFVLTMYSDRNSALATRITNLCFDSRYSINTTATLYATKVNAIGGQIGMFTNDQGLFATTIFRNIPKLRDMEMDFGIIPYPMYDNVQGEYGGYVSATYSNMYAVELHNQDLERTGAITEYIAYTSKNYVTPAYYEQTLKGREARDEESIKCLEIIFANRSFDAGVFYEIGSLTGTITNMMKALTNNFDRIYNSARKMSETKINQINEKFKAQQ